MMAASRDGEGPPEPVCIDYSDLISDDPTSDLQNKIQQAFGPDGLGLLTVKNIPNYIQFRQNLLPLSARLAQLPNETKSTYEDPLSYYNFGWSCGKETLEDGIPDFRKGSFYANPLCDRPTEDPHLIAAQPAYCRPNIWTKKEIPELENAFKSLGKTMYDTGVLLAGHCTKMLQAKGISVLPSLEDVLTRSQCHKGRLLCYLPPPTGAPASSSDDAPQQWCGWHKDHACITALTSALYTDALGNEVSCKDLQSGLYVKNRKGESVRIVIPPDHLAFQLGEAFQIMSGGILQATPHCVVAPRQQYQEGLYRNTFAVFMQPKWDEVLHCPAECDADNVGVAAWLPGTDFGQFSKKRFADYYKYG